MALIASSSHQAQRIAAIDTLRGGVMALMLVDHVREFFFLHRQVSDPMDLGSTDPTLFFTRLASHFCAPIFIFLAGLGAWCYGQKHSAPRSATSAYLAKRGLFLIVLELTLVNFAWTFSLAPAMIYLQVIWAIGLAMLALAALLWLPARARIGLGLLIVAGHHLFDGLHFTPDDAAYPFWAILHDRSVIELSDTLKARTSYPVLPWIGVILLGHACGPLYARGFSPTRRTYWLTRFGVGALALFVLLRWLDLYGDHPRAVAVSLPATAMSWLNLTKYPPSLLFLLFTLGVGGLALAALERRGDRLPPRVQTVLNDFGRVPMFFYILHLYALHGLHLLVRRVWGSPEYAGGGHSGIDAVWQLWLIAVLVLVALYPACRRFAGFKQRRRGGWTAYF